MALVKFDIASSKIFVTNINPTVNNRYTIIAISNNEVFYSYTTKGSPLSYSHLVHAKYEKSRNKSIDTLKELYHQSVKLASNLISTVDENTETIWSAFRTFSPITIHYFQYNMTDHTLIGSDYTYHLNDILFGMNVAGEIV